MDASIGIALFSVQIHYILVILRLGPALEPSRLRVPSILRGLLSSSFVRYYRKLASGSRPKVLQYSDQ